MKITYDTQADAMYIYVRKGKIAYTKKAADLIMLDYDEKGNALGVEVLTPSLNLKKLPRICGDLVGKDVIEECRRIIKSKNANRLVLA